MALNSLQISNCVEVSRKLFDIYKSKMTGEDFSHFSKGFAYLKKKLSVNNKLDENNNDKNEDQSFIKIDISNDFSFDSDSDNDCKN